MQLPEGPGPWLAAAAAALALGAGLRRAPGVLRAAPRVPPRDPPLERLARDLHRLLGELERIERSDLPAKAARLRATALAYDDVLLAAARALEAVDLPPAVAPPLPAAQRIEVEAALARQGLRW
ncbi:hypothetical protein [Vallicoccus soli]|uniref:hypothetical protein n=1 Tax=Vallicoccus soli TaxID=2339232 RepID=UPI001059A668|nr:hypothetical protein [Vallicoccus soli]